MLSADLLLGGCNRITERSVAFLTSKSGDTAETLDAARYLKERGVRIFSLVGRENSPLQEISDGCLVYGDGRPQELARYIIIGRIMHRCGCFDAYPRFADELRGLGAALADVRRSSVRRAGVEPEMLACDGTDAYLATLRDVATRAADEPGLCALVVETRERAHWLSRQLGDVVTHLHRTDSLPKEGVVLIDLALAKGLEFDHVVVADAQEDAYPDTPLGRRRLYTAISRAMHRVTLVSQGPLTSILG